MKQFKGKKIKSILAYLLCVTLVFENAGFTALAKEVQTPAVEVVSDGDIVSDADVNTSDGNDMVSGGDIVSDGDVVSGGDVSANDPMQGAELIASGTYCEGVAWTLSTDGLLTVEGTAAESLTADRSHYTRGWADYAQQITSAKVNVKGVKSFYQFFYGCSELQCVDFAGTDTSDAENMAFLFYGCSSLETLDVSDLETGNVTAINSMFSGCSSLLSLDVTGFDTSKATSLGGMFNGCESLKVVDVSGFKTDRVTNLSLMFSGCTALEAIDLSNFNTQNVIDTNNMFYGCSSLTSLDLSGFDTGNLKLMDKMFAGCTALESIDMSSWNLGGLYEDYETTDVFKNCTSLALIKAPKALAESVVLPHTMYTNAGVPYTALPLNAEESVALYKENPSDNVVAAFGKYYGMDWTLNDKGELSISGTYDADSEGASWDEYREDVVSVKVTASGVTDTSNWFKDMIYLENVDVSAFDTSNVRYMNFMFYNCSSLTELDLSNCSINAIYEMSSMFEGCTSLSELKFAEGTKTGSLMDMTAMFKDCKSLEELDMSSFWMGYLVHYDNAFSGMESLSVLHTPTYVIESVALPHGMYDATGQVNYFLPLWLEKSNTLTVEKPADESVVASGVYYGMDWTLSGDGELVISGMYNDSEEGTSWYDYRQFVKSVKITATGVKSTKSWFGYMSNLVSCDLSAFDTSQVTDMSQMFFGCSSLTKLDVTGFNTSNVTDMSNLFAYCDELESLDVSGFDTSKVTKMRSLFSNCEKLEYIDVSGFDTSKVTLMDDMFADCHALKYVDVSGFDTSNVTDMSYLFCGCSSLEELDLSHFKTSNVEEMDYMFYSCLSLKSLDVSGFDTGKVTDMDSMFRKCESLTSLELSDFNTSAVENMDYLFADSAFKKLDLSSFSAANVTSADHMFLRCDSLIEIQAPCYLNLEVYLPYDMVDESGNLHDMLPLMAETSVLLKQSVWGIAPIAAQMYTGKAIKPEVTVMYGNVELKAGVDYTVSYKNNVNAASKDAKNKSGKSIAPTVIVKGKGNYTGTVQTTFEIEQVDFWDVRDEMVVTGLAAYENGKVQKKFKPTVMLNGKKLQYNKDFYVYYYYYDSEDAYKVPGTYSVSIEGMGNYTGSKSVDLTILAKDQVLASKLKIGKIPTYYYEAGNPAKPNPAVSYKGKELVLGRDYSISYENNSKPGKASLVITGLENDNGVFVAGTVTKTFTIKGTAISKAKVTYNNKVTFTGKEICPAVTLTVGKGDAAKTLRPYYDYTVSYSNNVKAGKGTILIKGCGEYTGTVKKSFTIQAMPVAETDVIVAFAGGKAEAAYAVSGAKPEITVTVDGVTLVAGKDYTVSYKNNKKLAKVAEVVAKKAPTMVLKGKGNYKFTKNVTFDVVQMDIENLVVSAKDMTVGSKSLLSAPAVIDRNGKKLKVNKDYTVSYTVNGAEFDGKTAEAGTVVTVTVTAKEGGNYAGSKSTTYRVTNKDISKTKITIEKQVYVDGGSVEFTEEMIQNGAIVITEKGTNKNLEYGVDYIITHYSGNNKKGTATVTIQGIGEYGGTKDVKFSIVSKKL